MTPGIRHTLTLSCTAVFGFAMLGITGCGPKYPSCNNDAHCKEKGEYCLQKKCAQCREAKHCPGAGEDSCVTCNNGACGRKAGCCASNLDCGRGQKCSLNRCIAECTTDDECPEGKTCNEQGACTRVESGGCKADGDCGSGLLCKEGKCVNDQGECQLQPVPFAFNEHYLSKTAQKTLRANYQCMKEKGWKRLTIEGHCDERGTDAYNMELGNRRARAVAKFLKRLSRKLKSRTVSYGKTKPNCYEQSESCWAQNRRAEFKARP